MKTIAILLSKMVVMRFFAIVLGISIFVLTLEVVSYSKEILSLDNNGFAAVARYMLFRSPGVLATYVPVSLLLALLLTFTELSYRNEITAIWASGISPLTLVRYLLPVALFCGAIHFALLDRGIPAASSTLRNWGVGDYGSAKLKVGDQDPIWLRNGSDVIRAARANATSTLLYDIVIFKRGPDGNLLSQVYAEEATLADGQWTLKNVVTMKLDGSQPKTDKLLSYGGTVIPAAAGTRTGEPAEMTIGDLSYFVANQGFGIRPAYVYETWWYKRFTPFISAILMVCLVVPLLVHFRRGGGLGVMFATALGVGFIYFIIDGVSMSAGELGFLPSFVAAWLPVLALALVAAGLMVRTERV